MRPIPHSADVDLAAGEPRAYEADPASRESCIYKGDLAAGELSGEADRGAGEEHRAVEANLAAGDLAHVKPTSPPENTAPLKLTSPSENSTRRE